MLFCFGSIIYNPRGWNFPYEFYHHEATHRAQQGRDPIGWWDEYIDSPIFRLTMELPAHIAEFKALARPDEQRIRSIADRLASDLYGNMISREAALAAILASNQEPNKET